MQFGEWLPDLQPYNHTGLVTARNVFASPLGYGPVKEYTALTGAIPSTWKGGRHFIGVDGTVVVIAGTNAGLYAYISSAWTNKYAGAYTNAWQFAQFGDLVIGCQGGAPVKYTIATATGAALGGTPPNGRYVTTVKDFVAIAGVDSANSTVYWSAINNAEGWTVGTAQSDFQILPDGGKITGISGGEYLLVFQREQIWRGQYVGPPLIYQFDKVSEGVGCLAAGSIARVGRMVLFLSQRGFYAWSDGELKAIGANKVDQTFFTTYSRADIESNITVAVDPSRKIAVWAMPNRLWVYNWELDRWSDISLSALAVSTSATSNITLEAIDILYPSGIETIPVSLDDPLFQGGDPSLAIIANDGTIGTFGATTNMAATLTLPKAEMVKGRDIRIRAARVDCDAVDGVTVSLSQSPRLGDAQTVTSSGTIRPNGDVPVRASGRYIQANIAFAAGTDWAFANAIDFIAAGGVKQ